MKKREILPSFTEFLFCLTIESKILPSFTLFYLVFVYLAGLPVKKEVLPSFT